MNDPYLDLLEDVLCFNLWSEPIRPMSMAAHGSRTGRKIAMAVDRKLRRFGLALGLAPQVRANGTRGNWPALADTMVTKSCLGNIRDLCIRVEEDHVPGSFVECGVWRGGASIYARACLPVERTVYCCDSFNGLPQDDHEPEYVTFDALRISEDTVRQNFKKYGLYNNVQFIRGYFKDSLHLVPPPIAILRADGDMYSSTMQILDQLYPKVSNGGYAVIDDYWHLETCKNAVDEYRETNHIQSRIVTINDESVYWRKP